MNKGKISATVSLVVVSVFTLLMIVVAIGAPWLFKLYTEFFDRAKYVYTPLLVTYYFALIPGILSASHLLRLLINIRKDEVFIRKNVVSLMVITAGLFLLFVITFVAGFFYFPFFIVSAAALFMGIILCVVKSVFVKATELKNENDLTI